MPCCGSAQGLAQCAFSTAQTPREYYCFPTFLVDGVSHCTEPSCGTATAAPPTLAPPSAPLSTCIVDVTTPLDGAQTHSECDSATLCCGSAVCAHASSDPAKWYCFPPLFIDGTNFCTQVACGREAAPPPPLAALAPTCIADITQPPADPTAPLERCAGPGIAAERQDDCCAPALCASHVADPSEGYCFPPFLIDGSEISEISSNTASPPHLPPPSPPSASLSPTLTISSRPLTTSPSFTPTGTSALCRRHWTDTSQTRVLLLSARLKPSVDCGSPSQRM